MPHRNDPADIQYACMHEHAHEHAHEREREHEHEHEREHEHGQHLPMQQYCSLSAVRTPRQHGVPLCTVGSAALVISAGDPACRSLRARIFLFTASHFSYAVMQSTTYRKEGAVEKGSSRKRGPAAQRMSRMASPARQYMQWGRFLSLAVVEWSTWLCKPCWVPSATTPMKLLQH